MSYGYFQNDSVPELGFPRNMYLSEQSDVTLYLKRKYDITYEEIFDKGITIDKDCIAYLKPPKYKPGLNRIFLLPYPYDIVTYNNKDGSSNYLYGAAANNILLKNTIVKNKDLVFTVYLYSFAEPKEDRYGLVVNQKYAISSKKRIRFLELIRGGMTNSLNIANSSSLYKNIQFAFELPIPCLVPDKWKFLNLPLIIDYIKNKDGSYRGTLITRSIPRIDINTLDERYTLPEDASFNNFTTGLTLSSQMIIDVTGI